MKHTLILIALLAATVSVKAQSKTDTVLNLIGTKVAMASDYKNFNFISAPTYKPTHLFLVGDSRTKPILTIDNPKNGWNNPIDSIIIHARKQKVRWLNDSTAVITK